MTPTLPRLAHPLVALGAAAADVGAGGGDDPSGVTPPDEIPQARLPQAKCRRVRLVEAEAVIPFRQACQHRNPERRCSSARPAACRRARRSCRRACRR